MTNKFAPATENLLDLISKTIKSLTNPSWKSSSQKCCSCLQVVRPESWFTDSPTFRPKPSWQGLTGWCADAMASLPNFCFIFGIISTGILSWDQEPELASVLMLCYSQCRVDAAAATTKPSKSAVFLVDKLQPENWPFKHSVFEWSIALACTLGGSSMAVLTHHRFHSAALPRPNQPAIIQLLCDMMRVNAEL